MEVGKAFKVKDLIDGYDLVNIIGAGFKIEMVPERVKTNKKYREGLKEFLEMEVTNFIPGAHSADVKKVYVYV